MSGWQETLAATGRLHPLLVHLPIGFLVLLVLLEVLARFPRLQRANASSGFILALAIPAVAAAALFGYLLSLGGGYQPKLLQLHLWTGLATTVALLLAGLAYWSGRKQAYRGVLAASFVALIAASHFGGSLTHGSDYLAHFFPGPLKFLRAGSSSTAPGGVPLPAASLIDHSVFSGVIQPILNDNCISCHGPEKRKAGLRLDSFEDLAAGGESGPVVHKGNARASLLIKRLFLPLGDENHMPPEGKPQPHAQELALIKWWIDAGASPDKKPAELKPPPEIATILAARVGVQPAPSKPQLPPRPWTEISPLAEGLASELGIVISQVSEKEPWLQCNAAIAGPAFDDSALAKLTPLHANLRWLDLAGTKISDAGLEHVGRMLNLTRVHLERTGITDAGLSALSQLQELEYLNLYATATTDSALTELEALPKLKRLYLWQTRVSPEAAKAFAEARSDQPQVDIWQQEIEQLKMKIAAAAVVVELGTIEAVVNTNAVPPASKPINTQCPISGKPVDPAKTVLHEGKLVAFCCDDCKAQFLKNPAPVAAKLELNRVSAGGQ